MFLVMLWLLQAGVTAAPAIETQPKTQILDEKARTAQNQTDHVRLSLPTEDDYVAWHRPGLRLALGYQRGSLHGVGPSPSFSTSGVSLRPSMRLSPRWAMAVTM